MLSRKRLFLLALLAVAAFTARADLTLPAIFSDHMVLQRDAVVPVWGSADAGATVTVEFANQKKSTTAAPNGRWRLALDPLPASATPRDLLVSSNQKVSPASGGQEIENQKFTNVLVGEVWLGSGQSNMAMTVNRAQDFPAEQAAATLPLIRHFREESSAAATPQSVGKGKWSVCSPDTVATFSATLYFFGRELHRALGVPVGLVNSSVGGTPIESWIAPEAQRAAPALANYVKTYEADLAATTSPDAMQRYETALAKWEADQKSTAAPKKKAAKKPARPTDTAARRGALGGLYLGKISPLIPFAIRGALWYQGEANTTPARAALYEHQLPLLVRDWRARWGHEFPFAWVQLPNFTANGREWPPVREAMLKTLALPRTGMAITIDVGEANDIHPRNKQAVGQRLALWALGEVYGRQLPATSGPLPAGHEIRGREIVLRFKHTDGGLVARGGGDLTGFVVAGPDRQWHPAHARIVGDTVVASSAAVAAPIAARYAWKNLPTCNLVNAAGLPASPFRTDDWK